MDRLQSIIVGIDFTAPSAAALRQAIRIAGWNLARLRAVHALESHAVAEIERAWSGKVENVRAGIERAVQASWQNFISEVPEASAVPLDLVTGDATTVLVAAADQHQVDLLVLGTHGRSHGRSGAGSNAQSCTRKARSKVLLVEPDHVREFKAVLGCVDFSETSRTAVEQAINVATHDRSALHILHVFDGPWNHVHYRTETMEASPEFQQQYCENLRAELIEFTSPYRTELQHLNAQHHIMDYASHGGGITKFAKENGIELVVMGTRGRNPIADLLLGSTAERVLRDTPASLLSVKPA